MGTAMATPKTPKAVRVDPVSYAPITEEGGKATGFFATQWNRLVGLVDELRALIVDVFNLENAEIIAGPGLDGGGTLQNSPITLSADVQEILDQISTTHGAVIFRGSTTWQALAPGTVDYVLATKGASADPQWVAQSGGGGSGLAGAMSARTTNQSITLNTDTRVTFTAETYDDDGFVDIAGQPTRITIPTGYDRAILVFNVTWGSTTGNKFQQIWKNGALTFYPGQPNVGHAGGTAAADRLTCTTGVIPVVAGDYFEGNVFTSSTQNVTTATLSIVAWNSTGGGGGLDHPAVMARVSLDF